MRKIAPARRIAVDSAIARQGNSNDVGAALRQSLQFNGNQNPMIDALISGRLYGHAEERSGQAASHFVTCKVKASTDDGDIILCNVIAFNDHVKRTLLSLQDGESISISGAITPKIWFDKQSNARPALDVIAHTVLTLTTQKNNES